MQISYLYLEFHLIIIIETLFLLILLLFHFYGS